MRWRAPSRGARPAGSECASYERVAAGTWLRCSPSRVKLAWVCSGATSHTFSRYVPWPLAGRMTDKGAAILFATVLMLVIGPVLGPMLPRHGVKPRMWSRTDWSQEMRRPEFQEYLGRQF